MKGNLNHIIFYKILHVRLSVRLWHGQQQEDCVAGPTHGGQGARQR